MLFNKIDIVHRLKENVLFLPKIKTLVTIFGNAFIYSSNTVFWHFAIFLAFCLCVVYLTM